MVVQGNLLYRGEDDIKFYFVYLWDISLMIRQTTVIIWVTGTAGGMVQKGDAYVIHGVEDIL